MLDAARDLLRIVRMALVSEWFDLEERRSLAAVTGTALGKLDRVYAVLSEGGQSTPTGKMVIPEFVPEAAA